jgi:glycosyltransferase involved in cell wall biosynthesis
MTKKYITNIVQVSAYYPPHLGGLERVLQEVAEQLAKDNYGVTVLTSDMGAKKLPKQEQVFEKLLVKRLWAFEFAHTAFIPGLLWQLFRIRKPSLFHLHMAQAHVPEIVWLVAKLRGIPYIVHFHLDVERSGKLGFIFDWWKRWILPRIMRDAAMVITLSQDQSALIHNRYKVSLDKIRYIGNGVSEKFLDIGRIKRNFHSPLRLLFVGRLALQKRPERLIEAMSLVTSNVILNMVGDGEDKAELEKLTEKSVLKNVTFSGRLDGEKLLDAYNSADVFVLPSDKEGMPLVLLEAMATGLPIIGSDVLGIHELIEDVGILVENPSPETFAQEIDKLAQNPNKLNELSASSYKKASMYSWKNLVEQLEEVYKEILL